MIGIGGEAGGGVEAEVAVADAQHVADAVVLGELEVDRADDVVQPGAESAAGDDGGGGIEGVEVDAFARAGLFKQQVLVRGFGRDVELVANAGRAGDEIAETVAVGTGESQGRGLFVGPERGDVKIFLRQHSGPPRKLGTPQWSA